jgi:acyl-CoA synthetase (AMP-forming)/AMP-acid ligase II
VVRPRLAEEAALIRDYAYPLRVAADRFPDHTAFLFRETRWSFREFDAATDRLAAAFERRSVTGRHVILLLGNEPTTVLVYLALARAGAVSVPVNPRLLTHELSFIADDCEASVVIADAAFAATAAELREQCPAITQLFTVNAAPGGELDRIEDLLEEAGPGPRATVESASAALVVYTSGTSGTPKGVERTHDANLWTCVNSQVGQPRFHDDVELFVLPLFGIAFIFQVMPMILAGGTTVLDGQFDPARGWELLEAHRVTRVFLAPTMLDSMLQIDGHERYDTSALRILNSAYEFPERVRRATAERFGEIVAYMYGLTEAQLCCSTPVEFAADPSDAGHPMGMMRIRVVDDAHRPLGPGEVGEIAMEGPSLMTGYHRRADATAEALSDGWLYTGDLGYLDDSGRIHVAGRKKLMIKTGGFSVDPLEVENTALQFPGVAEAAVVGVADEHWGEQVVAFVSPSAVEEQESDLALFLKSRLAGFKCPKRIIFVAELPKNPMGKIERARLRELAETSSHQVAG